MSTSKAMDEKAEGEIAAWARGQDAQKIAALKARLTPGDTHVEEARGANIGDEGGYVPEGKGGKGR